LGFKLKSRNVADWKVELEKHTDNALFPLLSYFTGRVTAGNIKTKNTKDILSSSNIVCGPVDNQLICSYIRGFIDDGLISDTKENTN